MKKNSQIHVFLETKLLNNLKKEAENNNISVSELCRQKLREQSQLNRIETMLKKIIK